MKFLRPTLLLDKQVCLQNIERMASKAKTKNLLFRPHFKTHQSAMIGDWFRDFGVKKITVSSISMANYFAAHGWKDITIAFPVNFLEIDQINELAKSTKLNLLVENKEAVSYLSKFLKFPVGIFIKIDTGYNRTGILAGRNNFIDVLLEQMGKSSLIEFKGFLTHAGHNYQANSKYEIFNRHFDSLLKMKSLKNRYKKGYPNLLISIGDTPACSICENFDDVDEIRPGNFVFYDLMQYQLGSCNFEDIALSLICPIVAKHPSRNELVIYGGAIHLSKDQLINTNGKPLYGRIAIKKDGKKILLNEKNYVSSVSQEHGIIKVPFKNLNDYKIGEVIEIIPVHACLTANLIGNYLTTEGEHIPMIRTQSP